MKRDVARAAVWAFASTVGAKITSLAGLMLLARLLAPHEFGLLAFAMVYITYAETIGDLGTGMALVYWPDRRDDAAQLTFLTNTAAGLFWTGLTLLIAPAVADFFNAPNGVAIIRALAPAFLIKFLGNTHDALAQKDLRFRARAVPEVGLALVKATVSLAFAAAGFGAWSLVWGHLAGVACSTVMLWIVVKWRPNFTFPRDLLAPMLGYGRSIISVNVLSAVVHHIDLAIVGRMLGATALGLYQMASKVPEMTVIVLLWVVSKVLFPAFSRMHAAGESLSQPFFVATRYVAALSLPACAGLWLLAEPIVVAFFGPQWRPGAPILAALAVYAAFRAIGNPAGDVLKATGRAGAVAGFAVLKAVLVIPATIAGARFGPAGVAGGLAIAYAVATIATLLTTTRMIGVRWSDVARTFAPSVAATLAMSLAVHATSLWTASRLSPAGQVASAVAVGLAVYAGGIRLFDPRLFTWARGSLFARKTTAPALGGGTR
jgi:lipopolysaccharide exporter